MELYLLLAAAIQKDNIQLADAILSNYSYIVNVPIHNDQTPLMVAASVGNLHFIQDLLKIPGIDLNEHSQGLLASEDARSRGYLEVAFVIHSALQKQNHIKKPDFTEWLRTHTVSDK
jgi:ankyrin repeat protein